MWRHTCRFGGLYVLASVFYVGYCWLLPYAKRDDLHAFSWQTGVVLQHGFIVLLAVVGWAARGVYHLLYDDELQE